MKPFRFMLFFVILMGAVLACNLPIQPSSTGQEQQPETNSTQNPTDTPEPTATSLPPTEPLPTPTEEIPTQLAQPAKYFPSGYILTSSDSSYVTIYDLQKNIVAQIQTPGLSGGSPSNLHLGGNMWEGAVNGPLIFTTFEDQGMIKQNFNGQTSDLIPGPDIFNLSGAIGHNIFVFNQIWYANETLASQLYIYNPAMGGTRFVHEWLDSDFTALFPMGIDVDEGETQGIWYTYQPWGIGGDIVFPPLEGLLYLDLNTGNESLILAFGFNPVGLSTDKSLVAYVPTSTSYLEEPNPTLKLYHINTGMITEILLLPGSDRGAGYAVFSPDNRFVAWMEASGWQMAEVPNFTSRVRIANINGQPLVDLPVQTFADIAGVVNPTWAKPVGWLDAESLLVQVLGDDWNYPALVNVQFDSSGMTYLGLGYFGGFVYP